MSFRTHQPVRFLFYLLPLVSFSVPQAFQMLPDREIRITDVRDANLFFTEDSQYIALANIHAPSIQDKDSLKKARAREIIKFAEGQLRAWPMRFVPSPRADCRRDSVTVGHLYKIYPLSQLYINALFLEKGLGFYLPCDTLHKGILFAAAQKAIEDRRGVWKEQQAVPVNPLRRIRGTVWLYPVFAPNDKYIPVFGFNYRWSDLIRLYRKKLFYTNLTAEAGTFAFFYFPYLQAGLETGYGNLYLRLNYGSTLPLSLREDNGSPLTFYGLDVGFRFHVGKSWMELEYNLNRTESFQLNLLTLSFIIPERK